MASLTDFNPEDFKDEFTPIPVGTYKAIIVASDTKQTKDGRGSYLKLSVDIIDGEFKGRKLFHNINLVNSNDVCVKIGKTDLANICRALGISHPKDSCELHNKPLMIKVNIKPESGQYPASNEIKGWTAIENTEQQKVVDVEQPKKMWEKEIF